MPYYEESKPLFGKVVRIILFDIDVQLAKELINDAYEEGLRLQKIFNYYDSTSELSLLNRKRSLKVSNELLFVINKAISINRFVPEYNICLGKVLEERKNGHKTDYIPSMKRIRIDGNKVQFTDSIAKIDLGSIAKGYIVDKMIEMLRLNGVKSGLIEARGDILCFGNHINVIQIQHPRESNTQIMSIRVKNMAVATSGDYNQYYGSYETSHIINSQELISVTTVGSNLMEADVLATALFVATEEKELIRKFKSYSFLTIDHNLKLRYYNGFSKMVVS